MAMMNDLHVDVMGLAETQTPWKSPEMRDKYHKRGRHEFGSIKTAYGSPSHKVDLIKYDATYQAGGTVTSAFGDWATKVLGKPIQDATFSGLTFLGKGEKTLTLITAYRVCDGTNTHSNIGGAYSREWTQLCATGVEKPDPRASLLDDLTKLLTELTKDQHEAVLMMDSNEVLDPKTSTGLAKFVGNNSLTDIHRNDPAPSTNIHRPNQHIDHMFRTSGASTAIKASGTLTYNRGIQADHQGLFVDIDIEAVLEKLDPNRIVPGDLNCMLSGTRWLIVFNRMTIKESHAAGEAPLLCSVPNKGSKGAP